MKRHRRTSIVAVFACAFAIAAGCKKGGGNGGGGGGVAATIHVLRGASSGPAFAPQSRFTTSAGLYFLSPDQAKVTIDAIHFIDAAGGGNQVELTDCTPTYERSAADLTPLLDCPFTAPIGSWVGIQMLINPTTQVLINDTAHGLFTSAAGLSTTPPGNVDFTSVTVPNGGGDFPSTVYFPTPLVISSTNAEFSIFVDMNHTLFANVDSAGTASFNTSLPVSPASVIASQDATGRATFYSATGTADNYDGGSVTGDDTGSVRLYYPTEGSQPGFLFFVTPGPGEAYPINAANSQYAGGYLGRDASGTLCWANAAQDQSWAHYKQFCAMHEQTNLGMSTTLECKNADPAPTPVSGDTYASGCPTISSPDFTETLYLVAD